MLGITHFWRHTPSAEQDFQKLRQQLGDDPAGYGVLPESIPARLQHLEAFHTGLRSEPRHAQLLDAALSEDDIQRLSAEILEKI